MQVFLLILLALVLIYCLGLATSVVTALLIVRRRLREYQESGPFGY
jgi:hypothetical protein